MEPALPPLVLLHGFCESQAIFRHLIPDLLPFCNPITPDLPGFGANPFNPRLHHLDDYGFWLRDYLDGLGLERVVLAGHSMGGYLALAFAEHFPQRILALGLLHTTALADPPEKQENRTKTMAFIEKHGHKAFLEIFVPSLFHSPQPAWLEELHRICSQADPKAIVHLTQIMRDRPDRTQVAAHLPVPLMYVTGAHDALVPPERNQEEWAHIPMAIKKQLAGAGHMGMYENPEAFLEALESLVQLGQAYSLPKNLNRISSTQTGNSEGL